MFGGLIALFSAAALGLQVSHQGVRASAVPATALPPQSYLVVRPARSGLLLHATPGGPALAWVGAQTYFGRPRILGVVARKGAWLGVTSDLLPNGRLGWVRPRGRTVVGVVHESIRVSLSALRLEFLDRGRLVRSFRIGVGATSSPTPLGRYAVAEKIPGRWLGSAYGCCVLGLTAHQPHPPASWRPGNYLVAIHGGDVGSAASAGCIHLGEAGLRYLMRRVPVGTPVFINR